MGIRARAAILQTRVIPVTLGSRGILLFQATAAIPQTRVIRGIPDAAATAV